MLKKISQTLALACIVICAGWPHRISAGALNFSPIPLFLGGAVGPNIFIELDDSGSMDWDIQTKPHWHGCGYDPDYGANDNSSTDCSLVNEATDLIRDGAFNAYNGNSTNKEFKYVFDNADDVYDNGCTDSFAAAENCLPNHGPLVYDWRIRATALNVLYYNPNVDYKPWPGKPNASFTAARSNPQSGEVGYSSTRDLTGFVYEVTTDDSGYSGSWPRRGTNTNKTNTPNGMIDLWDSHTSFTIGSTSVTKTTYTYNNIDETVIIIIDSSLSLNPTIATTTLSGSDCFTELGGGNVSCRTIAEAQQNIANWYQYYRRRSFVAKGAIGTILNDSPNNRYGLSVINNYNSLFIEVPSASTTDFTAHNNNLVTNLYSYNWPAKTTPLRSALERTGKYFDGELSGKADPIINACQQNFTILFTDGYWNGDTSTSTPSWAPLMGDADGDGRSVTLADVARHYYTKDLSSLPNKVPANPADPATHQHMVTFGVAFGLGGKLVDTDGDGWPNPVLAENGNWGNPFNSDTNGCGDGANDCPEKLDDLWHAAFNSKGRFFAAQTPGAVLEGLRESLKDIQSRTSSASSVVLNSGATSSESRLYQARFRSDDWSGQLFSYPISSDGTLGSPNWEAGLVLNSQAYTDRKIITYKPSTAKGIPFRWPSNPLLPSTAELDTFQLDALNDALDPVTNLPDLRGSDRLNYLRGKAVAGFRSRVNKHGDIVHSSPAYVGKPPFHYPDNWGPSAPENASKYSAFRVSKKSRERMIYVGANDGMLHAIHAGTYNTSSNTTNAGTGQERFAYVPSVLFKDLNKLTDLAYNHRYYVDGTPTVVDAFFGGSWHTVLVGSLRAGGQGIFALDITNPPGATDDESTIASKALWEFTDKDTNPDSRIENGDKELGFSFSQPNIVRMHNDKWAAVFGNGYNNMNADGNASTNGNAVLYIVDIEDGNLLVKIDTKVGASADPTGANRPNGLATVAPVDVNGDYIVDYIYAGDLFGNLWKFDVTGNSPGSWDVKYTEGSNPKPLFTAKAADGTAQPITTRPQVGRHPDEPAEYMVYFGTGKYFEVGDNSQTGQTTQTFYGIRDKHEKTLTAFDRSNLVQQKILKEVTQTFSGVSYDLRVTTDEPINWKDTSTGAKTMGWYMDLINTEGGNINNFGERQVSDSILRNGRIIFATLIPSTDPCDFGGTSWLMELDAINGGRLDYAPFDLNGDNYFNKGDFVNAGDIVGSDGQNDYVAPGGKKSKEGIITTPGILLDTQGNLEQKYSSGSTGNIEKIVENTGPKYEGRTSWRELR